MIKKQFSKSKQVCKVTFTLPKKAAKGAKVVKVLGDFNDWNWRKGVKMTPMRSEFKAVVELETGRKYQFRYMIDNKIWENDWAADEYVPNDFGMNNSVVVLPKVKGVPVKKSAMKKVASKSATAKRKTASRGTTAKRKTTGKSTTAKRKTTAKSSTAKRKTSATAKKSTGRKMTTSKKVVSKTRVGVIKQTDLRIIEGVGPKICTLLNKAGIKTFKDLSKCSVAKLKKVMMDAGPRYQMHNPTSWPKQAKLAAANKWTELKKMQAKMK